MADESTADASGRTETWQRIWDIFHDALERPPVERDGFLGRACAGDPTLKSKVQELLDAHESADDDFFAEPPSFLTGEHVSDLDPDPQPGDQIGPYCLEAVIGEGGMGVVYRAQQRAPVRRQVALKLLQLGMATRDVMARFEAERQALAMMSHSNIAKVYDAGATAGGRPYFVMEYVDGAPITDYCDDHRLDIDERLRLFLSVCDGVQHAHQKGVIHRDLKPSNVLVAMENQAPVPKIIDFGIAKATDQSLTQETLHTRMGVIIGTPAYMSPEQAGVVGLDVDTRTDVYSLGVLLYRLLVGVGPFEAMTPQRGIIEMQRLIRDEEPQRPGTRLANLPADELAGLSESRGTNPKSLLREINRDFSWIALKAMEKDRERRYLSVSELSADIRRYLNGLPVEAHAHTAWYRAAKFARRHTIGVAVTGLVAFLIVGFAGFMTLQTVRLQKALEETTRERTRAEQVSDFMVQLFGAANPNQAQGEPITVRQMLDKGAAELKEQLNNQPRLRAALLATMGVSYRVLGEYQDATELLERALADLRGLPESPEREIAIVFNDLGEVQHDLGNYDEAQRNYRRALDFYTRYPERAPGEFAEVLANLSDLFRDRGSLGEAESFATQSLEIGRRAHGERSGEVARLMQRLGYILRLTGDHERALAITRGQLEVVQEVYGDDHPFTASALNYLGNAQRASGDAKGAQASLNRAAAIYRKTHGGDNLYLASTLNNLGLAYSDAGQLPEAEAALRESVKIGRANFGPDNPSLNSFRIGLGNTLVALGRWAEAEQLLRLGLETDRKNLDPNSPYLLATVDRMAALLGDLGRPEEAEPLLLEALASRREMLGEDHSDTGVIYHRLAMNHLAMNQLDAAEPSSRRAVEIHRRGGDAERARLATSLQGLGRVLHRSGDLGAAQLRYEESAALLEGLTDDRSPDLARLGFDRGALAEAEGDRVGAATTYAAAAAQLKELLPESHPDIARVDVALGRLRCRTTEGRAGLDAVLGARTILASALPADNWQLAMVDAAAGECQSWRGNVGVAEQTLLDSYATLRKTLGDQHYRTGEVLRALVEFYERSNRPVEAGKYRAINAALLE